MENAISRKAFDAWINMQVCRHEFEVGIIYNTLHAACFIWNVKSLQLKYSQTTRARRLVRFNAKPIFRFENHSTPTPIHRQISQPQACGFLSGFHSIIPFLQTVFYILFMHAFVVLYKAIGFCSLSGYIRINIVLHCILSRRE
jgi:hypothetical protein